jgi:hypothetical protein
MKLSQHEVILSQAIEAVNKATHCLMTLDLALINFDHKNAQREIGNLQEGTIHPEEVHRSPERRRMKRILLLILLLTACSPARAIADPSPNPTPSATLRTELPNPFGSGELPSKYIFAAFGVAVLALLMSLTYSALTRIFPDSLTNRMWGLVMFDIAAMCWAIAFVFSSGTTGQYATSAIGFVVGFIGTLGMVAAEVMLSSGQIASDDIGQWMVYGFIMVTALHAALLYAFHAASGEIHGQIEVGIARGEIVTEARREATRQLDESKRELAHNITQGIVSQVKRDLDSTKTPLHAPARLKTGRGMPPYRNLKKCDILRFAALIAQMFVL